MGRAIKTIHKGREVWRYGDAFEQYPVEEDVPIEVNGHHMMCGSITDLNIRQWLTGFNIDYAYVDPPWNQGNISSFYTKAGMEDRPEFWNFIDHLISVLKNVRYDCFIEMGDEHIEAFKTSIEQSGGRVINDWRIYYYKTRPCRLVQATWNESKVLLEDSEIVDQDDEKTPMIVLSKLPEPSVILDACTGLGLTATTAHELGHRFVGVELNPRRLAHAVKGVSK